MKKWFVASLLLLSSCEQPERAAVDMDDLTTLKKEFLQQILSCNVDEGPFTFSYKFRTIFSSKEVISLLGTLTVHDRLPHGWKYYEGKTFCMINNQQKEVFLNDLFRTHEHKEFLRQTCEKSLKKEPVSYFSGGDPLRETLTQDDIQSFVVDDSHLIIIFQPYTVGGGADGPFVVRIPFTDLQGHWEASHPLPTLIRKVVGSCEFTSSWDQE
jgi:hypothetical protein